MPKQKTTVHSCSRVSVHALMHVHRGTDACMQDHGSLSTAVKKQAVREQHSLHETRREKTFPFKAREALRVIKHSGF